MAFISLQNVGYRYPGGPQALEAVNMEIGRGEHLAVIGQNGAGKTTLAKLCNRLLRPGGGNVFVDGRNTRDQSAAGVSRIVGYVFQNPDDQIFHSTVGKEVAFGPRTAGFPPEKVRALTEDALALTGLAEERGTNPYDLPPSLRAFVGIASVIAMDTGALILDEPTAGQDLRGNRRLRDIIDVMRRRGKTLIAISHDMDFVAENFPRIVVMADKGIIADGGAEEVFWDFAALERARLRQPSVSRICLSLGITGIVRLDDAARAIMERFGATR
jgi:energy-coupling factor transport system ATP-binding protein